VDCQIGFEGDLTAGQLDRLVEISERCPVHRTLTSETLIRTTRIQG
jgi:putative redox protein